MFSYLRNLFRKKPAAQPAAVPQFAAAGARSVAPASASNRGVHDSQSVVQRVETAQLQLAAIVARFPDDLRKIVLKQPPPEAMVALPLPTILKFLPSGSVKMSLASVVRQAPPGTFAPINVQDKRLVDVPLAEIFKRVSPAVLKRRNDQKYTDLAAEGFDLFGDEENPHSVAPRVSVEDAPPTPAPAPRQKEPAPAAGGRGVLQVPPGVVTAPPPGVTPAARPAAAQPAKPAVPGLAVAAKMPGAKPVAKASAAPKPAPVEDNQPPLVVGLAELIGAWPEPYKSEVSSLNGATVSLPSGAVGNGLAKGKVAFTWGELRSWMNPAPAEPSQGSDDQELILSLRAIAPIFMKQAKGGAVRSKNAALDESIPELFSGGRSKPAAPAPTPAPAPAPAAPPAPVSKPAPAPAPAPSVPPAPKPAPKPEPKPAPAPAAKSKVEAKHGGKGGPAAKSKIEQPAPKPPAPAPAPAPAPVEPTPAPAPEAKVEPAAKADLDALPDFKFERKSAAKAEPAPKEEPVAKAEPLPEPEPEAKAEPVAEPKPEPAPEPEAKAPEPAPEAKAPEPQPEPAPAPASEVPTPAPEPEPAPAPAAEAPTAAPAVPAPVAAPASELPKTIGEALGQPDKSSWSPSEIVKALANQPLVAGSVVALQEGLVIAHQMPEPFKGEVFAAFLPQVFARINQYSGEMKLGSVNELIIHASNAPCAIFRRGQIYFAVLGRTGEELPIHILRLCADTLASQ